jgi:hypothetical protein
MDSLPFYVGGEDIKSKSIKGIVFSLSERKHQNETMFTFLQSTFEKKDNVDIEGCYIKDSKLLCESFSHRGNLLPSTSANYRGKEKMAFNSFVIDLKEHPYVEYIVVREKDTQFTQFILAKFSTDDCIFESLVSQRG